MRVSSRWPGVTLVPIGTIAGHLSGSLLAGEGPAFSGPHSHLRPASWLAVAAAVGALSFLALSRAGVRCHRLTARWLTASQIGLFGAVEALEHLHAGHGGLAFATEASFRWGVAAQLASAAVLAMAARLARATGALVRARLAAGSRIRRASSPAPGRHVNRVVARTPTAWSFGERGPPARLASA